MKIVNAKTLQLAMERIDEYRAKYRKEKESFGFHFSGGQVQGWTNGVIQNGMLYVSSGSTTSPTFEELGPYAELRTAQKEGINVGHVPAAWRFPYPYFTAKLLLNPSKTSCQVTFELIKANGESETSVCDMGWKDYNEVLWFSKIESNFDNYKNKVSTSENAISQIKITVIDQDTGQYSPFYIQYVNFCTNELLKYSGPINILDGQELNKYLEEQTPVERKYIFDKYTHLIEHYERKPSDTGCSTCDTNVCFCDGTIARYGYTPCQIDACQGYQECSCNASCNLEANNRCACDHMFYTVETTDPYRSISTPIDKGVKLLTKIKPQLQNLIKTGPNTYKKIVKSLPGYLAYRFDTPYIVDEDTSEFDKAISGKKITPLAYTETKNWSEEIKQDPRFEGAKLMFIGCGPHDFVIVVKLVRGFPTKDYWQWGRDPKTGKRLYEEWDKIDFWDDDNDRGVEFNLLIYEIHSDNYSYFLDLKYHSDYDGTVSHGYQRDYNPKVTDCNMQVYETSVSKDENTGKDVLKYSIAVNVTSNYMSNGFVYLECLSIDSNGKCDFIQRRIKEQTWYRDSTPARNQKILKPGDNFYFLCMHKENMFHYTLTNNGNFLRLYRNGNLAEEPLYGIESWWLNDTTTTKEPVIGLRSLEMYGQGITTYPEKIHNNSSKFPIQSEKLSSPSSQYYRNMYQTYYPMIYSLYSKIEMRDHNVDWPYSMQMGMSAPWIYNGEIEEELVVPAKSNRPAKIVRYLFQYIEGEDFDAVYALDVSVNNKIFHSNKIDSSGYNKTSWTKLIELEQGEYVCSLGFSNYFEGTNKFFIYKSLDGNVYLKALYIDKQDKGKGIKIPENCGYGWEFVSLSDHGILTCSHCKRVFQSSSNMGFECLTVKVTDGVHLHDMPKGELCKGITLQLDNVETKLDPPPLKLTSLYYDSKKTNSEQMMPCACDHVRYTGGM